MDESAANPYLKIKRSSTNNRRKLVTSITIEIAAIAITSRRGNNRQPFKRNTKILY